MATTGTPAPAPPTQPTPPPGWYPNPEGPGQRYWDGTHWAPQAPAPAPPSRGRSHGGRYLLVAIVGVVAILAAIAAAVLFTTVEPKSDAKDVLRDARPLVQRSITVSGRARRDAARFVGDGGASVRRRAIRELDQTISLRRRAIRKLGAMDDISFPGDKNYKDAAEVWADTMRSSIRAARGLRASIPATVSPGYFERKAEATLVITQTLYLRRYDQILRKTDRDVIAELV